MLSNAYRLLLALSFAVWPGGGSDGVGDDVAVTDSLSYRRIPLRVTAFGLLQIAGAIHPMYHAAFAKIRARIAA